LRPDARGICHICHMVKPALMYGMVVQWFGRWTCDSNGRGFYIRPFHLQLTISGKLLTHTHTDVPALFTRSRNRYRREEGDDMRGGR